MSRLLECCHTTEYRLKVKVVRVWPHYRVQAKGQRLLEHGHTTEYRLTVKVVGVLPLLTTEVQQRNALAIQTAYPLGDGQQADYSCLFPAKRRQKLFYPLIR